MGLSVPVLHAGVVSVTIAGEAGRITEVKIHTETKSEYDGYFQSCARIRGISVRSLVNRLLGHIGKDQMVSGILDDQDNIGRRKGEHPYRGPMAP